MVRALGAILIVLGVIGLAWGVFAFTTREKVLPIQSSRQKKRNIQLPPAAGAVSLLGGVAILSRVHSKAPTR